MKKLTKFILSICFVGYIKFAPGTWGSLVSIGIMYLLFKKLSLPLSFLILIFIVFFFISIFLINYFSTFDNSHDSKHIVIDEFLGIFIVFLFYNFIYIYNNFVTFILIFFIFRFFDIMKIFPANYIDKNFKNGFGVILDDIVAGLYTILSLVALNAFI